MKKIVLMLVAALMVSTSATFAQKVDVAGINAKLAKANEATEHPKKGLKASTWIAKGDAYLAAFLEPTKALYVGIDLATLEILCGKSRATGAKDFGSKSYNVHEYPYFRALVQDGKVVAWEYKMDIKTEPKIDYPKVIMASYRKAMELDPSTAAKAKVGLTSLAEHFKLRGQLAVDANNIKGGAAAYLRVAAIQSEPAINEVDPLYLFYAGYMYTVDGESTPASYTAGENTFNRALKAGYDAMEDADESVAEADRGNIYYYLFHCAYGVRNEKPAKLQDAKKYLEMGLSKYPKNEKIFEGLLQLYTSEDGVGDPKELLSTIQKSIDENNDNINAWFGRGRIYFALKNYEECIKSFSEVVRIQPTLYDGNYYLGLFYMLQADAFLEEMNAQAYTDRSAYNEDLATLNVMYAKSIPYFEAAYEIRPTDRSAVEYLKQLCFRLRDEDGIMEKYTKYNELYKALPQQ